MSTPYFWNQPFRYMRYASHANPALFWSVMLGFAGPAAFLASFPVKRVFGVSEKPTVPSTYPGMEISPGVFG